MRSRAPHEVIRRRWRWLVAVTLVGLLAGLAYWLLTPKTYRSSASAFFSLQSGGTAADLVQGSTYTQSQVASFARLARAPVVLDPVIDQLRLKTTSVQLARQVDATAPPDTVIVEVTVTDSTAAGSARIANAVIGTLSTTVERLAPVAANGQPTVRVTTVAPAQAPSGPASPNLLLDLAAGLVAGLVIGAAAAWAREAADTRVRDASVVAEVTDLPVIGTIATNPHPDANPVVLDSDRYSPQADFFRQLGTNLQFLGIPSDGGPHAGVQTVMVTSSLPMEGKSTVAANLAAVLAETKARVLLVDADLRRPAVARMLGVEGAVGLSTVLIGQAAVADVIQDWGSTGMQVLPAGPVPPNSSELLNSPAMRQLMEELRRRYDYIVLDAAPVLPVADATILTHAVDGTIVVANVLKVRRHQLSQALLSLDQVNARTLGVVLNQVDRKASSYVYLPQDGSRARGAADEGSLRGKGPATAGSAAAGVPGAQPAPSSVADGRAAGPAGATRPSTTTASVSTQGPSPTRAQGQDRPE